MLHREPPFLCELSERSDAISPISEANSLASLRDDLRTVYHLWRTQQHTQRVLGVSLLCDETGLLVDLPLRRLPRAATVLASVFPVPLVVPPLAADVLPAVRFAVPFAVPFA